MVLGSFPSQLTYGLLISDMLGLYLATEPYVSGRSRLVVSRPKYCPRALNRAQHRVVPNTIAGTTLY